MAEFVYFPPTNSRPAWYKEVTKWSGRGARTCCSFMDKKEASSENFHFFTLISRRKQYVLMVDSIDFTDGEIGYGFLE